LLFLHLLSLPLIWCLFIFGWKREKILRNAGICGLTPHPFSLFRFYQALVLDLLRFGFGEYGQPLRLRPRDNFKLQKLKTAPSILLTAHFHNWELMGAWMGRHGVPLLGGARPLSAPWAQSILVR